MGDVTEIGFQFLFFKTFLVFGLPSLYPSMEIGLKKTLCLQQQHSLGDRVTTFPSSHSLRGWGQVLPRLVGCYDSPVWEPLTYTNGGKICLLLDSCALFHVLSRLLLFFFFIPLCQGMLGMFIC